MFLRCITAAFILIAVSGCSPNRTDEPSSVDLASMLQRLTNIAAVAQPPLGKAGMISTYDRSGGNSDWAEWNSNSIEEDGRITLARLDGPGCVTRIWMTHVRAETWEFYFDGEDVPRIAVDPKTLFGGGLPFKEPLCGIVSGGHYCYLPLPYAKALRIAIVPRDFKPGTRSYYHISHETFPKDVRVTSFPRKLTEADNAIIAAAARDWKGNSEDLRDAAASCEQTVTLTIEPGQRVEWLKHAGAGELTAFTIDLRPKQEATPIERARMLREIVLKMWWDDVEHPSVQVPLGDFFCNALYRREFSSAGLGYLDGVYICRFPMPFADSARAELVNDGPSPVNVRVAYRISPPNTNNLRRYFHATWNRAMSRGLPFTLLRANGKGHFLGCYLTAIGMDGTWTILEGDESFRVDGETLPSIHGTGLEDYFNGAWYYTGLFDLPLHGLVEKAPIRTDQYRFHLPDPVAFEDGLQMNMEFGHGNRARGYMSSAAYWYQSEPHPAGGAVPHDKRRQPPPDPLEPVAIMAHLFELERAGLYPEAVQRCLVYAEKYPDNPTAPILQLRALAYQEHIGGLDTVERQYRGVAERFPDTPLGQQADALLWFHEDPSHALLTTHISGKHNVFLDGKLVVSDDNPATLNVHRLRLAPGAHEMAIEVQSTRPGSFVSLALRTHTTNIVSSCDWEYVQKQPPGWPDVADAAVEWKPFSPSRAMLPTMSMWRFVPNAFINTQSGRQLVMLWPDYKREPTFPHIFLRTRLRIPGPDDTGGKEPAASASDPSEESSGEETWEEQQSRSLDRLGGH